MKKLPRKTRINRLVQVIKMHSLVFAMLAIVSVGIIAGVIALSLNVYHNHLNSSTNSSNGTYSGSLKVSNSPNQIQLSDGTNNASNTQGSGSSSASTTTTPSSQSNSNASQSSSNPSPQSNNSSGSGSSGSSTPPSQPSTLANCEFVGGPRDGQACPASAPTSWSYSTPCYGNGSGLPCPTYSQTGWITASYQSGATYCEFDFRGDGNTTGAQYKRVKVTSNNGANAPDCMTAYPM